MNDALLYAVDDEGFVYFAPEAHEGAPLRYEQMAYWLPESVVERFGQPIATMTFSGVTFDPDDLPAITAALKDLAVSCREDSALPDRFSAFE